MRTKVIDINIRLPTGWAAFSDQSWSLVLFDMLFSKYSLTKKDMYIFKTEQIVLDPRSTVMPLITSTRDLRFHMRFYYSCCLKVTKKL